MQKLYLSFGLMEVNNKEFGAKDVRFCAWTITVITRCVSL